MNRLISAFSDRLAGGEPDKMLFVKDLLDSRLRGNDGVQ